MRGRGHGGHADKSLRRTDRDSDCYGSDERTVGIQNAHRSLVVQQQGLNGRCVCM